MNGPCNAIYPEKIAMSQENCPFLLDKLSILPFRKIIYKKRRNENLTFFKENQAK